MQVLATNIENAVNALCEKLTLELKQNKKVLWLVSGGSNVIAAKSVMDKVPDSLTDNLTVGLIDERYGPLGHSDSNWQSLVTAGFNFKHATLLPALKKDLDFEQTCAAYESEIRLAIKNSGTVIGLLGMGSDGHIAGILPNSPAATDEHGLVCAYDAPPLKRLTLTFHALSFINHAYVFAFGDTKKDAINELLSANLPLNEQPAQFLKKLPEVYLYNDEIGDKL